MITFAIDLLWVRYGKIGGGVAVALNLLDGFMMLADDFKIYLVITRDNQELFAKYTVDSRFELIVADVISNDRKRTVIAQNLLLAKILHDNNIKICLEPDNTMPIIFRGKGKDVTIIHDLQALHFPEYFSKAKMMWLKINWSNTFKHADRIVAISEFTKKDILQHFNISEKIVDVIFDPVVVDKNDVADLSEVYEKYNLKEKDYYYTVSSLGKNKNLITLLDMMSILKEKGYEHKKLVISGIGEGKDKDNFIRIAEEKGITDNVILTGFVDNATRNALYKGCEVFLFPSIFEGFGMPPIEAKYFNAKVITTRESSIPEVTQNAVIYVCDPYDAVEWAERVLKTDEQDKGVIDCNQYNIATIARQYLDVIKCVKVSKT